MVFSASESIAVELVRWVDGTFTPFSITDDVSNRSFLIVELVSERSFVEGRSYANPLSFSTSSSVRKFSMYTTKGSLNRVIVDMDGLELQSGVPSSSRW